jgi:hypothetical protein
MAGYCDDLVIARRAPTDLVIARRYSDEAIQKVEDWIASSGVPFSQ